jgi:acetylornithine/N-succinyldiaminopimelate aminotransferase
MRAWALKSFFKQVMQTSNKTKSESIIERYQDYVAPTYGRFPLAFVRGEGRTIWDADGKAYLDFGGGIAVTCLGHAHPEITETIHQQAGRLTHVSNLYHIEEQAELAERLGSLIAPGKMFFCNSGAEANETLYKLARRFGHEQGRFEIITAVGSFHGRTLAGIAATGQDKIKKGFGPIMEGFSHVPFNNLDAVAQAITPATIAVLIEGIQGEGGIHATDPEYAVGLRKLCDEKNLLLLWDGVQCGHFRTGKFQSYQRILENSSDKTEFLPDAVGMAKSMGSGFPIGGVWIRSKFADLLGPGSHGTTFGGTPLASAVALKTLDVIQSENLADHARAVGDFLINELNQLASSHQDLIKEVRGFGLMIGVEFNQTQEFFKSNDQPASLQLVNRFHAKGLLTVPSGTHVFRLLPALNTTMDEAREAIEIISQTLNELEK